MKEHVTKLAAFTVAGLVTTLGFAWVLAAAVPMHTAFSVHPDLPGDTRKVEGGSDYISASAFVRFGSVRRLWFGRSHRFSELEASPFGAYLIDAPRSETAIVSVWSVRGPLAWGALPEALHEFQSGGMPSAGLEEARGWPALALCMEFEGFSPFGRQSPDGLEVRGGISLPPASADTRSMSRTFVGSTGGADAATVRALPLRPIWAGILFDTLFFGGGWWALFAFAGLLRRHRRILGGRCPRCAYDLRGEIGAGWPECGWRR